jgi:hypothetical protein
MKLCVALAVLTMAPVAVQAADVAGRALAGRIEPPQPCTFPAGSGPSNDRFAACGGAVVERGPQTATKAPDTVNRLPRDPEPKARRPGLLHRLFGR